MTGVHPYKVGTLQKKKRPVSFDTSTNKTRSNSTSRLTHRRRKPCPIKSERTNTRPYSPGFVGDPQETSLWKKTFMGDPRKSLCPSIRQKWKPPFWTNQNARIGGLLSTNQKAGIGGLLSTNQNAPKMNGQERSKNEWSGTLQKYPYYRPIRTQGLEAYYRPIRTLQKWMVRNAPKIPLLSTNQNAEKISSSEISWSFVNEGARNGPIRTQGSPNFNMGTNKTSQSERRDEDEWTEYILDHEPTSNWNIKKTKLQKPIQKPSLIINDVWIKVPWSKRHLFFSHTKTKSKTPKPTS